MTQEFVTLPRDVVEQAMDALEDNISYDFNGNPYEEGDELMQVAAAKLRAALDQSNRQSAHESELMMNDVSYRRKFEQPQVEQEPFLWLDQNFGDIWDKDAIARDEKPDGLLALYTNPQPPRQPLIGEAERQCPYPKANPSTYNAWLDGWEAAERAHGIK